MQNDFDNSNVTAQGGKPPLPGPAAGFLVVLYLTAGTCAATLLGVFDARSLIRTDGYFGFALALVLVVLGGLSGSAAAALHARSFTAPALCRSVTGLLAALLFFDMLFIQYSLLSVAPLSAPASVALGIANRHPVWCGIVTLCIFFHQYFQNSEEIRAVFRPKAPPKKTSVQPNPAVVLLRLASGAMLLTTLFSVVPFAASWKISGLPWQNAALGYTRFLVTAGLGSYVLRLSFRQTSNARLRIVAVLLTWPVFLFALRLAGLLLNMGSPDFIRLLVVNGLSLSPAQVASLALAWYFAQSKEVDARVSPQNPKIAPSTAKKDPL